MSKLLARAGLSWNRFTLVLLLVVAFSFFALAYSFIGFLQPQHIHLHEYSLGGALEELGGHFLFGAVVALPMLDLSLVLLSGGVAVFIDADHLLGALNAPVSSRPDHSILFILASILVIYFVSGAMRLNARDKLMASAIVAAALLSHLSFDVYAALAISGGKGFEFPFFAPYSFSLIPMPFYSWVLFELLGILITSVVFVYVLKSKPRSISGRADTDMEDDRLSAVAGIRLLMTLPLRRASRECASS